MRDSITFGGVILDKSSTGLANELARWPLASQNAWRITFAIVGKKDEDLRASIIEMHIRTGLPVSVCRDRLKSKKD